MRIAIFGMGGVGGFFGGKLAQAGEEVFFIARGVHLEAIRRSGLVVNSVTGDFTIQPARAESDPAAIGPVDVVLVAVKAWQVQEAARAIRPLVGAQTIVIPLENGVEAAPQLAEVLGKDHVAGGFCRISSLIAAPGVIRHEGVEPIISFNWPDGHADPRLDALRAAYERVGVKVEMPADVLAALWVKFIFISSFSGVGAVTHAPSGVQLAVPETRQMLIDAIAEVSAVGRACGVNLPADIEQRTLAYVESIPPHTTASMQRDILEGRPSELEYQTGSIVRLGKLHGVPTPTHSFIYASLLPLEQRARGKLEFSV